MQNGEKHRAFEREAMLARTGEVLDDPLAPGLLPQSFEDESGPDASRRACRHGAVGDGVDDNGFRGEACARSQQSLQLPALAQILDAAERRDHLLAHLRAAAAAFDDLEIGAAARGLLAEIHVAEPYRQLVRGAHIIGNCVFKVNQKQRKRGTTLSRKSPLHPNNINDLQRAARPQL